MRYDDLVIEIADILKCPLVDADDALRLVLNEHDENALDRIAERRPNVLALAQRVQAELEPELEAR